MIPIVGFSLSSTPPRAASFRIGSGVSSPKGKNVVAIKIAPFDRYQTLDVVRAVAIKLGPTHFIRETGGQHCDGSSDSFCFRNKWREKRDFP